jgi:transposase InsO family protein
VSEPALLSISWAVRLEAVRATIINGTPDRHPIGGPFRALVRASRAPHRLGRNLVAGRPGQVWLADLTYIATDEGWLCLAARKIVGEWVREGL